MSDTTGEPARGTQEQPPDTRLAERLMERATRPLGLIDVRRAEAHYARIMDWLAARTPLLEHLRSRYGLTEAAGAHQVGLAFADSHGHARAQGIDEAFTLSAGSHGPAAPDSFAAHADEPTFTLAAHVPDDPSDSSSDPADSSSAPLRITRRGVPTFSAAAPQTLPDAGTHTEPGEGGEHIFEQDGQSAQRARGPRAPLPVREIPAPAETDTRAAHIASQAAHGAVRPAPPPNPSVASPPLSTLSSPQPTLSPRETAARARAVVSERGDTSGAAVAQEEVWQSTPARSADARTFVASGSEAGRAAAETSLPFALARELPASAMDREPTTSRESHALPLATPPSDGARAGQTQHGRPAPTNGRPAPTSGAETFEQAAGVVDMSAAARVRVRPAEINVERLTEQVSRHLARRLLVERERRGLGRK